MNLLFHRQFFASTFVGRISWCLPQNFIIAVLSLLHNWILSRVFAEMKNMFDKRPTSTAVEFTISTLSFTWVPQASSLMEVGMWNISYTATGDHEFLISTSTVLSWSKVDQKYVKILVAPSSLEVFAQLRLIETSRSNGSWSRTARDSVEADATSPFYYQQLPRAFSRFCII